MKIKKIETVFGEKEMATEYFSVPKPHVIAWVRGMKGVVIQAEDEVEAEKEIKTSCLVLYAHLYDKELKKKE